jgi:hypothetical protein
VTFCCQESGISERLPLQAQRRSCWGLTAETEDDVRILGKSRTPAFALSFVLTPLLHPGRSIATRIGLCLHFVCEPWWPSNIAEAMANLSDLWLRRLEEHAQSTVCGRQQRQARRGLPGEHIGEIAPIHALPSV